MKPHEQQMLARLDKVVVEQISSDEETRPQLILGAEGCEFSQRIRSPRLTVPNEFETFNERWCRHM
jgi:hypothetical protein